VEQFSLRDTHPSTSTPLPGGSGGQHDLPTIAPEPALPGYQILSLLGYGGMGVVYKARQMATDRIVALKLIAAGPRARPSDLARFRTENQAISRVTHPHIVKVWEVGEQQGLPYAALEYMDRGNLREHIEDNPLPPRLAAELVELLANAAQQAHTAGIIHRDLKPANVLLTTPAAKDPLLGLASVRLLGVPKISDFGLAKQIDGDGANTRTGAVLGTPSYMAPEQAEGRTKYVGPTTDIYSLGAILYECLTGRPPFHGETVMETLDQVRYQEPVPPSRLRPDMPREREIICLKCLSKRPRDRYASANELAQDLRRYLDGQPILARPPSAWVRLVQRTFREPSTVAVVALTISLMLIVGLLVQSLVAVPRPIVEPIPVMPGVAKTETAYFAAVGRRWGALEGIHRLTEAEAQRRQRSFRFTLRDGAVEKVESVDWLGRPSTNHNVRPVLDRQSSAGVDRLNPGAGPVPISSLAVLVSPQAADLPEELVCTWEYLRDDKGRVLRERARDLANRVVWTFQFASFNPTGSVAPQSATGFYPDSRDYPRARSSSGATHVEIVFTPDGLPREVRYRGGPGKPRPDNEGIFGRKFTHDRNGMVQSESLLGAEDEPMLHPGGFARIERVWDDEGNHVETSYLDLREKPALAFGSLVRSKTKYDNNGNPVRRETFGPDGKPTVIVRMNYDVRGHLLAEETLNGEEKLISRNGPARREYTYDDDGNCTRVANFDPDGKPARSRGLACEVIALSYDKFGRMHEVSFLDAQGNPAAPVREGPGGRGPGRLRGEECKLKFEYNDRGQVIARSALAPDDHPALDAWGASRTTYKHNKDGRLTEEALFARDGKPTRGSVRFARRVLDYRDDDGNLSAISYFDTDGQLLTIESRPGTEGLLELVLLRRADVSRSPLAGRLGLKHDDSGNVTEARLSGRDGVAVADSSGIAEVRCKYDALGALTEVVTYALDGRQAARPDGVARATWSVDELGNVTEVATFGIEGKLVVPKGPMVERPDGPAGPIRVGGVARQRRKFDGHNLVEDAYFDADDRPTLGNLGYCRAVFRYDREGRGVASSYLNLEGKEVRTRAVCQQPLWLNAGSALPDLLPHDVLEQYDGRNVRCAWDLLERKEEEAQGEIKKLLIARSGNPVEMTLPSGPVIRRGPFSGTSVGPILGVRRDTALLMLLTPGNLQANPNFGTWGEEHLP